MSTSSNRKNKANKSSKFSISCTVCVCDILYRARLVFISVSNFFHTNKSKDDLYIFCCCWRCCNCSLWINIIRCLVFGMMTIFGQLLQFPNVDQTASQQSRTFVWQIFFSFKNNGTKWKSALATYHNNGIYTTKCK